MKETLGLDQTVESEPQLGRPIEQARTLSELGSLSPRGALALSALAATTWFKQWLRRLVATIRLNSEESSFAVEPVEQLPAEACLQGSSRSDPSPDN
jgi:hypothetical protein